MIVDRLWELLLCRGSLDLKSKAEEENRPRLSSTLTASLQKEMLSVVEDAVCSLYCAQQFSTLCSQLLISLLWFDRFFFYSV